MRRVVKKITSIFNAANSSYWLRMNAGDADEWKPSLRRIQCDTCQQSVVNSILMSAQALFMKLSTGSKPKNDQIYKTVCMHASKQSSLCESQSALQCALWSASCSVQNTPTMVKSLMNLHIVAVDGGSIKYKGRCQCPLWLGCRSMFCTNTVNLSKLQSTEK